MISACAGGCYADYINLVRTILLYQLRAVNKRQIFSVYSTGTGKWFSIKRENAI